MVRAIMIVEMAGRPAAHLVESLEKHVGVLKDVEDIEVHDINISESRTIPRGDEKEKGGDGKEMFTAFAECDFETSSFARLSETMFDFMPSSVEVVGPSKVSLEMIEATDLLNNISGRLHRYDEVAKVLGERHRQMEMKLKMMQKVLEEKNKKIIELS
jgi:hypothetical protein